jgi:transposase
MYLRESKQRRADGSTVAYLQLAENVWNAERRRSEARVLLNCGRGDDPAVTERLRRLARSIMRRCSTDEIVSAGGGDWRLVCAWPYGDVYALGAIWQRLGISQVIQAQSGARRMGFDVERALFAMVANRCCAPCSKLYCWEQWLKEEVHIAGTKELSLQHLYRAMDFLEANKEAIEREIFHRVADLLNLDVEVLFYDTTSLHFEIDEEDSGDRDGIVHGSAAAGRKPYKAPRKRGHSKNGRGDAPQIVVGMAVTREGFPVRHWVFPGNTVDVTTVAKVKRDLKGWQLTRCLFVGDAGMVSAANFKALAAGGGKFLMCMPMRRGDAITEQVLGRPGRYRVVAENLRVKEVVLGDGERRMRYAVCFNPQEAQRQKAHREQIVHEIEAELHSLRYLPAEGHTKRVCALRASARYGKYLLDSAEGLVLDRRAVQAAERFDGKFVVHGNDDTLSAEDMALGYKQLQRVEQAWRDMKSGLHLRPVFHWAPHRIHAHVAITVLALLLERTAEHACADTWRNIRDRLRRIQLAQLLSPNGAVWQVTDPADDAAKCLKSLQIKSPAPVLSLA